MLCSAALETGFFGTFGFWIDNGFSRYGASRVDMQHAGSHMVCTPLGGKNNKPAVWLARSG